MSYLKIKGDQYNIERHDDIVAFLASFTSPSAKPKNFCIRIKRNEKTKPLEYKLNISDISREDGSGKSFTFKARGFYFYESWHPIGSEVEGYIRF